MTHKQRWARALLRRLAGATKAMFQLAATDLGRKCKK